MNTNWKLLEKQIVFDKFMRIEERKYLLPDGNVKNYYINLKKPSVCILALTEDQKVVMVEEYRPGPGKTLLEMPGGFVDTDEDPKDAAKRELLEETGYEGQLQFVTECLNDAYSTFYKYCFVATNCRKVKTQNLDESEFINVKLLVLKDFISHVRSGQLTDAEVGLLGLDYLKLLS